MIVIMAWLSIEAKVQKRQGGQKKRKRKERRDKKKMFKGAIAGLEPHMYGHPAYMNTAGHAT